MKRFKIRILTKSNNKYQIIQPLLLSIVMAIGMVVGYQMNENEDELISFLPADSEIGFGRVEEIIRFLEAKYLYEPNASQLVDDAIQQIFSKLDPFSIYIPKEELHQVNDDLNGHYDGLGIESCILNDTLVICNVIHNSPAEKAGLKKLDRIIAVDNLSFTGDKLDFAEMKRLFDKPTGFSIPIRIYSKRTKTEREVTVIVDRVELRSVNNYFMLKDSILYIKIDKFVSKTYREFMEVLEKSEHEGKIRNLVLDLRDNPGGYLTEVSKILSQFFVDADRLLVRTVVRNGKERSYATTGRNFYEIDNIIILINRNSASGSEVLAGVIQDWDRGLVIGESSFGKGLVQEQFNLSNGGAIRITVADYYLPTGRSIQKDFVMDTSFVTMDSYLPNTIDSIETLVKKRKLPLGYGIIPDIILKDSLYDQIIWPFSVYNDRFDKKIIKFIEKNSYLYSVDIDEFRSDFKLSQADLKEFEIWFEAWRSDENFQSYFEVLLRSKIARYLFDEQIAMQILLEIDPVVNEAINHFGVDGLLK